MSLDRNEERDLIKFLQGQLEMKQTNSSFKRTHWSLIHTSTNVSVYVVTLTSAGLLRVLYTRSI